MSVPPTLTPALLRVSLWRRFAAMVYDALALFGVLFAAAAVALALRRGETITPETPWFTAYLFLSAWAYLGYSWRRGRTLGMQSWKIRIIDARTGHAPRWHQTLRRLIVGCVSLAAGGLGFWRSLWHPEGATWHDTLSGTCLVRDYRPRHTRL